MYENKKICVGIIIDNNIKNGFDLLKQVQNISYIDQIIVCCDKKYCIDLKFNKKITLILSEQCDNINKNKNRILNHFQQSCNDYVFVVKDSIIIKNIQVFQKYILLSLCLKFNFLSLCFNKIVDLSFNQVYNIPLEFSINSKLCQDFFCINKKILQYVDFLDQNLTEYQSLMDFYLRIMNKDSIYLPFIFFPDISKSQNYVEKYICENNKNNNLIQFYNYILNTEGYHLNNWIKYKMLSNLMEIQEKYNTAVCAIVKYQNQYLDEWIQYYIKLGFDHIFLYENNFKIQLKKQYNNVTIIDWPFQNCSQQQKAYTDCLKKFGYEYDFIGFFDADEFLYIKNNVSLQDFLRQYSDCFGIAISWRVFGDNGLQKVQNNDYRVLTRFTKCSKNLRQQVKVIINCGLIRNMFGFNQVSFLSPHFIDKPIKDLDKKYFIGATNDNIMKQDYPAQIYHYICKTKQQFLKFKAQRNRADIVTDKKYEYESYWKDNCRNEVDNFNLVHFLDEEYKQENNK